MIYDTTRYYTENHLGEISIKKLNNFRDQGAVIWSGKGKQANDQKPLTSRCTICTYNILDRDRKDYAI